MGKRDERRRFERKPAELMAQYWDAREDELLDAVVSAAALVARADGRIDGAERGQLLDFLERRGILSVFTPAEILDTFERRVRELNEPGGSVTALKHLRRHAERSRRASSSTQDRKSRPRIAASILASNTPCSSSGSRWVGLFQRPLRGPTARGRYSEPSNRV